MSVEFSPLIPLVYVAILAAICLTFALFSLWQRVRGAWLRGGALAALCIALLNPVVLQMEREQLSSVVAVVVDRSQSQTAADRTAATDAAFERLQTQLAQISNLEVRVIEVGNNVIDETPATLLFGALASAMEDVPTSRIAGAIMITDGQIHDIPSSASELGFAAPVHGLITGNADEVDRRIELINTPRFGIVGEVQEISYQVHNDGGDATEITEVTVRLNGEIYSRELAPVGTTMPLFIDIERAGDNIVELEVEPLAAETSLANNKAVAVLEGIRENLRVLLVSGEPHSGERAWRNLLKSDTSVDLVHFTILRPPEKQDGTPIDELSLIAFPTRELFVEKINEFDLIVFDRYQRRGVLPVLYYDYISQYVEDGGALLIAAGPEHAGRDSIANTPLAPVLPANPTGTITDTGFYPRLSDAGRRHPVTRDLPGSATEPPQWGRWFRAVDVDAPPDSTVLEGPDGAPLLIFNRVGEGRVAMLMSDHGWLWARGFEGGGPHVALYRRIAHWLMKEPALEEEALRANSRGNRLTISRQTMSDTVPEATIVTPNGEERTLALSEVENGLFEAQITVDESGLFEISNGDKQTLVHVGALNAPEFAATISTPALLEPLAAETGGIVQRLAANAANLPQVLPLKGTPRASDSRMILKMTSESVLKGINSIQLFAGFFGLALLFLILGGTWYREGR